LTAFVNTGDKTPNYKPRRTRSEAGRRKGRRYKKSSRTGWTAA